MLNIVKKALKSIHILMTMAEQIRQQIRKDLKESVNLDSVRIDVHFENIIDPNQITEELTNEAKS